MSREPVGSRPRPWLSAVPASVAGRALLVVDDNATNRRILTDVAAGWGMSSRAAVSGAEALGWLRGGEGFDIAVLDMHMPNVSGLDVIRQLRFMQAGYPQRTPVIVLSADATVPQGTDIADAELGTKKDEDINADPRSIDQSIGNIAATYVDASSHRLGAGSAAMQEAAVPSFARFLQLVGDETDPGFSVLRGLQPEKAGGAGDIRQRKSASGAVALVKEQLPMRTVAVAHRPSASTERMTGELLVGTSGSVTAYADNDVAPLMRASALRAQLLGLLTTEAEAVRTRQAALRKDIQDSIVDDAGKHARAIVSSARSPSAQVHSELREAAQPLTDAPPLG